MIIPCIDYTAQNPCQLVKDRSISISLETVASVKDANHGIELCGPGTCHKLSQESFGMSKKYRPWRSRIEPLISVEKSLSSELKGVRRSGKIPGYLLVALDCRRPTR